MATLERAIEIAARHHVGQRDKAGAAYVLHPLRMMLRFEDPTTQIVSVLHDVVEDTPVELDDLRREGFDAVVVDAIDALTRRGDESYETFIERAGCDPLARRVKLADLEDNMSLLRTPSRRPRIWSGWRATIAPGGVCRRSIRKNDGHHILSA